MINQLFLFFSAAIISLLLTYPLIWTLRFFELTQSIRTEGPPSHRQKAGTPTMAGLGFVLTIIALGLIFVDFEFDWRYLALIILTAGFALIGLADDLIKVIKKQNLGLTFSQKMISQIMVATLFVYFILYIGHSSDLNGWLSFLGRFQSIAYLLFAVFIIVGAANAANLNDGLNGLLAGSGGIAFLAMALLAARLVKPEANGFALIAAGSVLIFLIYNFPKARAFMGDVGSLAIGAGLGGLAIVMHQELRLAIIGGVFVAEALSVILQVTSYKLFRRRIFKMAPLHHHFELLGLKEIYVVIGFWLVAGLLGIVGVLL